MKIFAGFLFAGAMYTSGANVIGFVLLAALVGLGFLVAGAAVLALFPLAVLGATVFRPQNVRRLIAPLLLISLAILAPLAGGEEMVRSFDDIRPDGSGLSWIKFLILIAGWFGTPVVLGSALWMLYASDLDRLLDDRDVTYGSATLGVLLLVVSMLSVGFILSGYVHDVDGLTF